MSSTLDRWQHTRAFQRSAVAGALVLTCMAAAWAFVGLANQPSTPVWQFALAALPVLALTGAGARQIVAIAKLPQRRASADEAVESARQGRRIGVLFGVIVAGEAAAIAIAAAVLASWGRPLLIPVAVIAIVGAHFLPLARVFRVPAYGHAGTLLLACAVASLLIADESTRVLALALSTAAVLWAAAAAVLVVHTGGDALFRSRLPSAR